MKRTGKTREIDHASSIFPDVVPGKKWKIFLPRRIIWQKWEEIVGEAVSGNAWPWYFRDLDCLIVAVSDNIWMQQLTYQKALILESLNRHLPAGSKLRDLRFFLGDLEEVKRNTGLRARSDGSAASSCRPRCPSPPSEAFTLLDAIQDKELKKVLRALLDREA